MQVHSSIPRSALALPATLPPPSRASPSPEIHTATASPSPPVTTTRRTWSSFIPPGSVKSFNMNVEPVDTNLQCIPIQHDVENNVEIQEHNNTEFRQDRNNEILGKVFNTPNEAYTFYNIYAFLNGFGVRIHRQHKNMTTNEAYRKTYVCNKQGFKEVMNNSLCENEKKQRMESRIGCRALLRTAKRKDEKWYVDQFNDVHNHPLINTPTKVKKHRSHKKYHLSMECKSLTLVLSQSGLKPSQIKRVLNVMKTPNDSEIVIISEVDMMHSICVRDPVGVTVTKGPPKTASRMKSFLEVNMSSGGKKKRTCSYCHGLGHYKTGCLKKKRWMITSVPFD